MSNGANVIIKQAEYMRKFRNAGATDAAKARRLSDLDIKPGLIFRRMQDKGVFQPGRMPDTFYMDANAAEEFIESRKRRGFHLLLLVIIVAALMFFLSRR